MQNFLDSSVPEPIDEAIAADQEAIAMLTTDGPDLGFNKLVTRAKRLVE